MQNTKPTSIVSKQSKQAEKIKLISERIQKFQKSSGKLCIEHVIKFEETNLLNAKRNMEDFVRSNTNRNRSNTNKFRRYYQEKRLKECGDDDSIVSATPVDSADEIFDTSDVFSVDSDKANERKGQFCFDTTANDMDDEKYSLLLSDSSYCSDLSDDEIDSDDETLGAMNRIVPRIILPSTADRLELKPCLRRASEQDSPRKTLPKHRSFTKTLKRGLSFQYVAPCLDDEQNGQFSYDTTAKDIDDTYPLFFSDSSYCSDLSDEEDLESDDETLGAVNRIVPRISLPSRAGSLGLQPSLRRSIDRDSARKVLPKRKSFTKTLKRGLSFQYIALDSLDSSNNSSLEPSSNDTPINIKGHDSFSRLFPTDFSHASGGDNESSPQQKTLIGRAA